MSLKDEDQVADSEDLDQLSDLGLHCLLRHGLNKKNTRIRRFFFLFLGLRILRPKFLHLRKNT